MRALGLAVLVATLGCERAGSGPPTLEARCDRGDGAACQTLGEGHRRGKPPQFDLVRAAARFRQACDAGELVGCVALALQLQDGRAIARDPKLAATLYRRACDGGIGVGCFNLGLMLERGNGVPADPAEAAALFGRARVHYERQCKATPPSYCSNLGILHEDGYGVERSEERASEIYRDGCARGHDESCINQALIVLGKTPDAPAPLAVLDARCTAGNALACGIRARFALRAKPPDLALGNRLAAAGCDGGDTQACVALGALHGGAFGHPVDPGAEIAAFDRGCVLGLSIACVEAATRYAERGDRPRAIERYTQACAIGDREACADLTRAGKPLP